MRYIVLGEISSHQYFELLDFSLLYSDAFGVSTFKVHKKHLKESYFEFFNIMKPYEEDIYQYHCPQHYEKGQKFFIYKMNPQVKRYIKQFKSFWEWKLPFFPEDITFYYNKKMWLNNITHEKITIIDTNDEKILKFLNKISINIRPL